MKDNMNKNKISLAISFAIMATSFVCTSAMAQTEVVQKEVEATQVANQGKLTQIGSPSGVLLPLKGFAKDLPLITVIHQITPNGWIAKKSDNDVAKLDTQMLVSWQGGSNWVETLGQIVEHYPLNVNINWDKKEITLMALENKAVAKTMIFELETAQTAVNNTSVVTEGGSEQTKPVKVTEVTKEIVKVDDLRKSEDSTVVTPVVSSVEPVVVPVVAPPVQPVVVAPSFTWTLKSDLSLKENVEAWAKAAGYRLVWLGDDYPVDGNRNLTGTFDEEDGPIKQLSIDYGPKSRVQQPLSFQFYQNATLVVENWKFEQTGFPQYSAKKQ